MMFLCLSIFQSNLIGSRKLNDGHAGLEQDNRSYALDGTTMENGRTKVIRWHVELFLNSVQESCIVCAE